MPPKKLSLKTTVAHQNLRLDQVLAGWLPQSLNQGISKAKVRKLIVAGAVYLNGRRVRIASKTLLPHVTLDVYVDLNRLQDDSTARDVSFELSKKHVLFEDEHLIAIDKPPGLPTQATLDEARDNLYQKVKEFLAKERKVSVHQVYLGLHHRLDRDTSGVILFTKTQMANPGIAKIFSAHLAQKTYQALVWGQFNPHSTSYSSSPGVLVQSSPAARASQLSGAITEAPFGLVKMKQKDLKIAHSKTSEMQVDISEKSWTVKNHLGKLKGTGKKARYGRVHSGGDFAQTDFRVMENLGEYLWLEAQPKTGRTHQIRVHLSESNFPILGDLTYGGQTQIQLTHQNTLQVPRLMLHAANLVFPHPILKDVNGQAQTIRIQSSIPTDFKLCLDYLRRDAHSSRITSFA